MRSSYCAFPFQSFRFLEKLFPPLRAKREKNDEFYTQRADIEAELGREDYWKHFKNATVFCNCDDPRESEFWRYFHKNFSFLGLKKLISTHFEKEGRKEGRSSTAPWCSKRITKTSPNQMQSL